MHKRDKSITFVLLFAVGSVLGELLMIPIEKLSTFTFFEHYKVIIQIGYALISTALLMYVNNIFYKKNIHAEIYLGITIVPLYYGAIFGIILFMIITDL